MSHTHLIHFVQCLLIIMLACISYFHLQDNKYEKKIKNKKIHQHKISKNLHHAEPPPQFNSHFLTLVVQQTVHFIHINV